MEWDERELPLAKWLIDKTNTKDYRTGKLSGRKHPKVDGRLLEAVGGRRELIRQAKIIQSISELGGPEYLSFEWSDMGADIKKIDYRIEVIPRLCKVIGITDPRERQEQAILRVYRLKRNVAESYLEDYCEFALEQLSRGNTKELSKIEDEDFLRCLKAMAELKEPEWKRVFSARIFGMKKDIMPSKVFERIYQREIIEVLKHSPRYEEGMSDDEILAAHEILSYSQTMEWKGPVEYYLTDENGKRVGMAIDTSGNYYGTMINAQTLEHAVPTAIKGVEKIIVIENKANYESMKYDYKTLYIFCHGYFSPKEVRFLKALMDIAPLEVQCYHWGDMDYGGIQIFLYNEKNIFPKLNPWRMDVASYQAALENGDGVTLSEIKRKKLEVLEAGKLEALKRRILENGREIEQEMLIV